MKRPDVRDDSCDEYENSLVGSDLGALTNSARLLDNDKYWVGVYN